VPQRATSRKATILLADDHQDFTALITDMLRDEFEIVGNVGDGKALVNACLQLKPDLIITDISMPELTGIDAAERLSKLGFSPKIIFLTVHADTDFVRACLDAGAAGYVVKSHVAADLLPAIQHALAGRVFVSSRASK